MHVAAGQRSKVSPARRHAIYAVTAFLTSASWADTPSVKLAFVAAISAAGAAVAAGCAVPWRDDSPALCGESPTPVTDKTLEQTLGRYGFELYREGCEPGLLDPTASYTNLTDEAWDTDEGDVIWASQGWVTCDLYSEHSFSKTSVRRNRNGGFVFVDILNVVCAIDASDPWQIERLELALEQLPKAVPN